VILNPNLIDAFFKFGSVNEGKTFLIFVVGPGGTSRNLTLPIPGTPNPAIGCPAGYKGNEQGIQVTFHCNELTPPVPPIPPAVVNGCVLGRTSAGGFILTVTGSNFKNGASVKVGGQTPKKVKFQDLDSGSNTFRRLKLKGHFCSGLPGNIVVTNPDGGPASQPFLCNESCPTQ
jgi:IPT/TIG domain